MYWRLHLSKPKEEKTEKEQKIKHAISNDNSEKKKTAEITFYQELFPPNKFSRGWLLSVFGELSTSPCSFWRGVRVTWWSLNILNSYDNGRQKLFSLITFLKKMKQFPKTTKGSDSLPLPFIAKRGTSWNLDSPEANQKDLRMHHAVASGSSLASQSLALYPWLLFLFNFNWTQTTHKTKPNFWIPFRKKN